jgi:PEGA domain
MSMRTVAALQSGFLLVAMLASATSTKAPMQITVLDSVTRSSTPDNNGVPQNCEQLTFDAYCRSTTNVPLVSTLLVQEGNQPPFRISCTVDSRYSRCMPLAKGETFEARREKHGIAVYYTDAKGKSRKQLYTLVAGKMSPQPAPAAPPRNAPVASSPAAAQVPAAAGQVPAAAAAPATAAAVAARQEPESLDRVHCSFASSPSGAEITLDGKYVGSTPSAIEVSVGTHVVLFSMPGFAQWKRDLTVIGGSELTVSAILQKQ